MSTLNSLIEDINMYIADDDPKLDYIKNPQGLLKSLEELQSIIGMEKLKESIARQTKYLLTKLEEGKANMQMLNTVLYGPPGVGKTTVGVVMAKIWSNLGFLKGRKETSLANSVISTMDDFGDVNIFKYIIGGIAILFSLLLSGIKWCYKHFGLIYLMCFFVFIWILFLVVWAYYSTPANYNLNLTENEGGTPKSKTDNNDDDIIKITGRSDFVDKYVGWSDKKTEKLLNDNKGKVIFIDEAYNLISGPRDQFGMEALTSITKFMSEHPDEIVIIFAGYEDQMVEGIFKVQPGLIRRCIWYFNIDEYSGIELFKIFTKQLISEGIRYHDYDKATIEEIIINNIDAFPSFGGDTKKLAFYTQLNQAVRKDREIGFVNPNDVVNGINELRENNIKKKNKKKIKQKKSNSNILDTLMKNPELSKMLNDT